jgi:hypothetical protein
VSRSLDAAFRVDTDRGAGSVRRGTGEDVRVVVFYELVELSHGMISVVE